MVNLKLALGSLFLIILFAYIITLESTVLSDEGTISMTGFMVNRRITRYPVYAEITEPDNTTLGIVAEGHLNFGRVPVGVNVRKTIKLNNDELLPIKIKITREGDISPYLTISQEKFMLESYVEIEIGIVPEKAGNYSGAVIIEAIKPNNWLSGWFIQWA
jgi:hypothetical protein